ncbi:MAG: hypothetical protein KDE55_03285 [Novosphingobium sp.]|nr:hypothetical protein [Novosphingobium sp.]
MIALLLGVLQIGIAMQNYNAQRGVSADVAREVMVQYQMGNEMTAGQIRLMACNMARRSPYNLPVQCPNAVTVETAANQRVDGAIEMTLTVTSRVDSILSVIGMEDFNIRYSRPIFVVDE